MIFSTNITLTVDVKLLVRRSFDTLKLKIIGPAKTGPAGSLPTAMHDNEKALGEMQHCTLAVVRRSQKFSSRRRPPSRGRRMAKI